MEQQLQKCKSLGRLIADLEQRLAINNAEREAFLERNREIGFAKQKERDIERLKELRAEQRRLVRRTQRIDSENTAIERRLVELRNDWSFTQCDKLDP
ncbi:MAG: hypothetical protein V3V97_13960 [Hyphomicrobiaceae bacterium]